MSEADAGIVAEFLDLYAEDQERGAMRSLEAYQALFPGHDRLIAERFAGLRRQSEGSFAAAGADRLGPYRLIRVLGRGGQGTVYLAEDTRVPRRVAIKLLSGLGSSASAIVDRFQREAEVTSRLEHPGVCALLEADVRGDVPYIVMRYVEGRTLASMIKEAREEGRSAVLDAVGVASLVEQVARALHDAHEHGVVHRDVKPSNIMVTPSGAPVLLDFGLARALEGDAPTLTASTDVFGTPAYMAPEQIEAGPSKADARTDVWALGVTLHECLSARRPFDAPTRDGLYRAILSFDPVDLRRLVPNLPGDLAIIVETALQKDPALRYQSALALAEDLRRFRERLPITARRASAWVKARRFAQRNPVVAASLILVFVVLAGALAVTLSLLAARDKAVRRYEGISDVVLVRDLEEEMAMLWPRRSTHVASMTAWLFRAEELRSRLPEHRVTRDAILGLADTTVDEPRFEGAGDRWLFEELTDLVARLERLAAGVQDVEDRRRVAEEIRHMSLVDGRDAWQAFLGDRDANGAAPGGLTRPIEGVVPLGRDRESRLWEFWHVESGDCPEWEGDLGSGGVRPSDAMGIVLVLLPAGRFRQGAQRDDPSRPPYDPGAYPLERPGDVELSAFFVSKYEMTQGQWERFTGVNPSRFQTGPRHPVEQVTWLECDEVLRRMGLALPTEAQWEYACRAGATTPWNTGADVRALDGHANLADVTFARGVPKTPEVTFEHEDWLDDGFERHAPVGYFLPNGFGLHDTHGNVAEWTADGPVPYDRPARKGDGYRNGFDPRQRGSRGGSFLSNAAVARAAARNCLRPESSTVVSGVRPSLSADEGR